MARDEGLEELVRDQLRGTEGLTEKAMFGGWAWLLDGRLLCGAREDGALIRLGKGNDEWALALTGVSPMISRGRVMKGWVRVEQETFADNALAQKLVQGALAFVRTL